MTEDEFLRRLQRFLKTLPRDGHRFAVEVRNKTWMNPFLYDICREHGAAVALIEHLWMSPPQALFKNKGIITTEFTYIRWLGDRKGIEKITTVWNESVVDRRVDMARWISPIKDLLTEGVDVYGYVNNHYGGYAPNNIDELTRLLSA